MFRCTAGSAGPSPEGRREVRVTGVTPRRHRLLVSAPLALLVGLSCLGGAVPAAGAPRAQAGDATARARTHFRAGQALYNLGNYTDALREFESGFELVPKAQFLINMAQCHRKLDDPWRARDLYERFLREAPAQASERGEVEAVMAELDAQIAGRPRPEPRPSSPVEPPSSPSPPLPAPPAAPPLSAPAPTAPVPVVEYDLVRPSPRLKWAAVGLGVGALVLGGVGGAMSALARSEARTVEQQAAPGQGRAWEADLQSAEQRGKLYDALAITSYALAGACVVGMIGTAIAATRPPRRVPRATVAPIAAAAARGGAVAGLVIAGGF